MDDAFRTEMAAGYAFDEPVVVFGSPILGDEVLSEVRVQVPLSRVNRHGLSPAPRAPARRRRSSSSRAS